ncbi:MAG: sulfite exporter TauE/SafE family protein [Actinomycetes bacterium]
MSWLDAVAVLFAGMAAGAVNAVVGSGTLITFPVLLAVGYPPVVANVSNTVGLAPGSVSGAVGYRAELTGQGPRLRQLGVASVAGGLTGGVLLLTLPPAAFRAIVPVLIAASCVLVLVQPWLTERVSALSRHPEHGGPALFVGVYLAGVYGGYFGAAQGVLLIALLGLFLAEDLQRINAAKNVLAALVNGVAAVLFIVVTDVAWQAAALIALGSVVGAQIGAGVGRRIRPTVLRALVVLVGVVAIVQILQG